MTRHGNGSTRHASPPEKDPQDLSVTQRLVQFLLHTDPGEAEKQLKAILVQGPGAKDAGTFAWARRSLALMYISGNPRRPAEALALFDTAGPEDAGADPEDRRVRAKVLAGPGDPGAPPRGDRDPGVPGRGEARHSRRPAPAGPDRGGRGRLAQVPRSLSQADRTLPRASPTGTPAGGKPTTSPSSRKGCSSPTNPGGGQDLAEAQELIEKLKRLQPDLMASLALEVALYVARNNLEGAAALIRSSRRASQSQPGGPAAVGLHGREDRPVRPVQAGRGDLPQVRVRSRELPSIRTRCY